jgi:type IV pilus assembly protein PilC
VGELPRGALEAAPWRGVFGSVKSAATRCSPAHPPDQSRPSFANTPRSLTGALKRPTLAAPSRDDVAAQLRRQRLIVVKIDEEKKRKRQGSVKTKDIVIFTRQFSTMINAGLPLVQALDILSKQSENKALQEVTRQVVYDVESGNTVADALAKHPKAFTELYTNMVAAGEAGGILDTILMRLATFLEKNDALVGKVKSAMVYPMVIMSVAAIAIVVLLIFVIPTFESMFASVNLALPLPTRVVIGLSNFLQSYWWMCGLAGWGVVLLLKNYYKTPGGKLNIDKLMLKLPILGDVLRKSSVSRFTRTLGTLISSGVSILDGLEITAKTAGNRVIHDAIMESRASIAGGDTISAPLAKSEVFPPMVISMIAVGEQTGGLDEMLTKIADFYDTEVDTAVSGLLSLMEPVMIVVLGVVVGGMVVAMYLPIFDMINAVQ